jgi:hypothetical protein
MFGVVPSSTSFSKGKQSMTIEQEVAKTERRVRQKNQHKKEINMTVLSVVNSSEGKELLQSITKGNVDQCLSKTLIEEIKESPLKFQVLDKWEKKALFGLTRTKEKLSQNRFEVTIDFDEDNLCYCDIGVGILIGEAYSLILQLTKEKGRNCSL